jgi:putative NIF3 family GTP cyclohydrolase 1 type 2/rhodanese-related sulfurtransferase
LFDSISAQEFRRFQEEGVEHILLDVQDQQSRKKRIPYALSVPVGELERYMGKIPKDMPVVVYGQNEERGVSSQAVLLLREMGVRNVMSLTGGVEGWETLNYPVENIGEQRDASFDSCCRLVSSPMALSALEIPDLSVPEFIDSEDVTSFLEARSPPPEFDHLAYEVKTTDQINGIFLMVNPDPRNFSHVPPNSLVICHHKISTHPNRIFNGILDHANSSKFNIFNFHLGWDIMEGGVNDSFLSHFGVPREQYRKVDLTYRGHKIPKLGSVIDSYFPLEEVVARLNAMKVHPSVILNPQCCFKSFGYIPGGGFVDEMVIEMHDYGVDALISSDLIFVVEIVARELGMTLIAIDHYKSERYALQAMQRLLTEAFPRVPTTILENHDFIQCPLDTCFTGPRIPTKQ